MTLTLPDTNLAEDIIGDLETPCDFSQFEGDGCPDLPAQWVMHRVPCCAGVPLVALACDPCKEARMSSEDSVECDYCGHVTVPARRAYRYIEPLNRRPT